AGDRLAAELLEGARLVAATLTGLPSEPSPLFGEFDLVILEEAQHASEADLQALAARAGKLVLVGDAEPDLPIAPPPAARPRRARPDAEGDGAARKAPLPAPPLFRLWNALHPDPRRLPGRCRHVNGRLVITLRPPPSEQPGWVQREQVFDRPEIELVIAAVPGLEP